MLWFTAATVKFAIAQQFMTFCTLMKTYRNLYFVRPCTSKSFLTVYLYQECLGFMFLQHVVEFMCGLTVKETKGILHYVGNRKQNTDDFHEISVCRLPEENPPSPPPTYFILKHGHSQLLSTLLISKAGLSRSRVHMVIRAQIKPKEKSSLPSTNFQSEFPKLRVSHM